MMGLPSFPFAEMLLFYGGWQVGFKASAHNPTEYAKSISIPTLLFYGAKDDRVSREETDAIYENLTGEKVLGILENSGHEVYLNDDSERWHEMVDLFLE